jgi:hypothetical protein
VAGPTHTDISTFRRPLNTDGIADIDRHQVLSELERNSLLSGNVADSIA